MNLTFDYITPAPLAGVTFNSEIWNSSRTFEQGKYYKIYAPSGKGKSTFIHTLYGLRNDYTGKVSIGGDTIISLDQNRWSDLRTSDISIVFQDLRLFQELTAIENIRVKTSLLKTEKEEQIRRFAEMLGVDSLLSKRVKFLSYGERQRVAIIRSLMQPFRWLLLDEPFGHLDEDNMAKACALIDQECKSRNAGMIITSLGPDYLLKYDHSYSL
jgi:ABC-type lipoprotein export system ATPase subunit